MNPEPQPGHGRENLLTVFLALLLGAVFLFFLYLLTFGFAFYIIVAVLAMVFIGYLHYAMWGFSMSEETAGEREEELIRQRMEAEELESRRRDH
jgi:predicted membrane protein